MILPKPPQLRTPALAFTGRTVRMRDRSSIGDALAIWFACILFGTGMGLIVGSVR